jgi:ATP-dependent exoDNAse (exonuclease V) alpha subunit
LANDGYYRLSVKIIGRSAGHSSVAAAAYRSGEKLHDDRTGLTHDYTQKKGVEGSVILAPDNAPAWVQDREKLWNEVERAENRINSQLAREVVVCFPRELSKEQREELAKNFVQNEFVNKGMIADVSFHNTRADDGGENPHAHIMLTFREITPDGFGQKRREWNTAVFTKDDMIKDKSELIGLRATWADYVNEALTDSGSKTQVSHLTNTENGKEPARERIPQAIYQMDKRGVHNEAFFAGLQAKQALQTNDNFKQVIKQPLVAKSLQGKKHLNDWEYIQARRSVEVDTTSYIAPPEPPTPAQKPSPHIGDFYYSNNLDNDKGLEI